MQTYSSTYYTTSDNKQRDISSCCLGLRSRDIAHGTTEYIVYYLQQYLKIQEIDSEVGSPYCI